jgi:O-Antigen ligase
MVVTSNRVSSAAQYRAAADVLGRGFMVFTCFALFYLYTNLGLALLQVSHFVPPSYFYVVILIVTGTVLVTSPAAFRALLQHKIFVFTLLAFALLEIIHTIFAPLEKIELQILINNIEYVLLTVSFVVIFSLNSRLDRIIQLVGLVVVANAGINLMEYYLPQLLPITFSTVNGRAAGFAADPNESAIYISLALPLAAFFAPWLVRYTLYAIALAGIAVTFSREGLLLWAVAVVVTEALKQREAIGLPFTETIMLIILYLVVVLMLGYAFVVFANIDALFPYLNNNTRSRLHFTMEDRDRLYLAKVGIDMFVNAPLFGNGVGSTRESAGVHNMFVLMLAELGLVGAIWIAAFLLSIARYGVPFGLLVVIMFSSSSLFTHNHFEWPAIGMLIALYLVVAGRYEGKAAVQRRGNRCLKSDT